MLKKSKIIISLFLSVLMIFSLISPNFAYAGNFDEEILEDDSFNQGLEVIENYNLDDYEIVESEVDIESDTYEEFEIEPRIIQFVLPPLTALIARKGVQLLVQQTLRNGTKRMLVIRNGHLASKSHPVTKVKFNKQGFPIFSSSHTYTLPNKYLKSTNATQFKYANANLKAYLKKNPNTI